MAGKKGDKTNITIKEQIYCTGCDNDKKPSDFYKSYGTTSSGLLPYCKDCVQNMSLDDNKEFNLERFKNMLIKVDRPYLHQTFIDNMNKYDTVKRAIGFYFKDLGMPQNRKSKYKDSIHEHGEKAEGNFNSGSNSLISAIRRNELIDKWGFGYSDEELYSFDRKYELLKNNYPEKTAMHTEALLTYIRYRVKEEMSTAKGDVGEAQKWGGLADKASERAKINPSQLSKADLSGGLNGFGDLARAVEKAVDIIEILPKFKEKPQDKVDFTLLCYINYVRRLKNLPDAKYKDIYNFYEERKAEYKKSDDNREFKFEDEE